MDTPTTSPPPQPPAERMTDAQTIAYWNRCDGTQAWAFWKAITSAQRRVLWNYEDAKEPQP